MLNQWREERESRGREGGADEENNSCNAGSGGQQEGDRKGTGRRSRIVRKEVKGQKLTVKVKPNIEKC